MKKILTLENFIYSVIFLLPIYLIKASFFGIPTNVLEILMVGCIVAAILKSGFRTFLKRSLGRGYIFGIGMIIAGLLTSLVISKNYSAGLGIIKSWFILPLAFAFAAGSVLDGEKKKNIYLAYYFSAVAVAAIGAVYLFFGKLTYDGRLQAFFNSPNYLAMYLAPAIIYGLSQGNFQFSIFNFQNIFLKKIWRWASLILILLTFYFTYSYAAWVALAVSSSWVEILQLKPRGKSQKMPQIKEKSLSNLCICTNLIKSGYKIILPIALLAGVLFFQIGSGKFQSIKNISERSSLQSRIIIWKSSVEILKDNFVFGIGPGNFQGKYLEYQKHFPPYLEWAVPHPHNIFLAFWLYAGLAGLVGFLLLMAVWFRNVFKSENKIKYLAASIMLYILLHGLVDTTYFKNDLAVVFWLNFIALL